jgi:hypothetical protein
MPEFGALALLDPKPKDLFAAIRPDAEGDGYRLVAHAAFVAPLMRIKETRLDATRALARTRGRFRHCATSSRTASVTALISSGETSIP